MASNFAQIHCSNGTEKEGEEKERKTRRIANLSFPTGTGNFFENKKTLGKDFLS
jgi:hypothetical protein